MRTDLDRVARLAGVALFAFSLSWAADPVACAAEEVTLYRDSWGVPHVYAGTAEAAAYGHGWAQAEDRLEDVLTAYQMAQGRAARLLGEARLDEDYVARVARHAEVARSRYGELSPDARRLLESFVAGIRAFMREHPDDVPTWAEEPEPWQVVALYRAFAWVWPWRQVLGELKGVDALAPDDRGSNAWVVGPSRSAEGGPIALTDPHLSWKPESLFYEAHVHGGDLNFFGFSIIGTPIMAVGHNDVLSFACTTGGPDTGDVYELRIDPRDPLLYEHDGKWHPIEVEEIAIEVKTAQGLRTERRRVERTHHGPILRRDSGRAWAVRTAYDRELGLVDQWLGMARSRNLGEFLTAMRANQALPQNILYADVYGNTYYVRAGRVPLRPPGFRWDRPVPGWTSETEWLGIHPFADLVQILNPPGGWMQNCNVSPAKMFPASPLAASLYPPEIYNCSPERNNNRGRRTVELLETGEKLNVQAALAIALDTHVVQADRWQQALAQALGGKRESFARRRPATELLLAWNRRMDVDSKAAALYRSWMRACREQGSGVPAARVEAGEPLGDAEQLALLQALDRAATEMREKLGRIDVPWGEVHRARRGGRSWPVAGCSADGISTLRSVRGAAPDEKGISWVEGGMICPTVVVLREGAVRSYSVTPFGQSSRPGSAHYTDQGEQLFSRGLLKPTWYSRAELLEHVESRRTLTVP